MTELNENNLTLIDALLIDVINDLTLDERLSIADLDEHEFKTLELVMGRYMKFRIAELSGKGNDKLLQECRNRYGNESTNDFGAASLILKEIWDIFGKLIG